MPVNETPGRQGPGDRMPTPMHDASEAIEWHRQRLLERQLYQDEVRLDQMRQERR